MKIEWNRKSKLNNKGNTLAIVIIGIFILSILGTLILSLTATNYKMKLNDKKSEDTFYYAEKALDEVYAKIETDAMQYARDAYAEVIGTYIDDSTLTLIDTDEASERFKQKYQSKLENNYREASVDDTLSYLETGISSVTNYRFKLINLGGTDATDVIYHFDSTTGLLTEVVLKNICVECSTTKTGFYSSIISDFTIKVPDITMNLREGGGDFNYDELFGYAVIAQGTTGDPGNGDKDASIMIDNDNTTITGNIYAGEKSNCDSVRVGNSTLDGYQNKNLNINAKNFVCKGPFTLYGSNATLRDINGTDSVDTLDSLQFYAKDIKLEKQVQDNTSQINLDIAGNCIVSDDMEVNGDYYNVRIKGNYFGYGFQQAVGEERGTEADSSLLPVFDKTQHSTPLIREHEQRSAIIINGKYADIDMTGVKQMILGGRAYIDLDGGIQSGGDVSYMTGESVSFKGNQQVYLADSSDMNGAFSGANPVSYTSFVNVGGYTSGTVNYSLLQLDETKVVAKKINDMVYFYKRENNPLSQTAFFKDEARNTTKLAAIKAHIRDDLHVRNLKFASDLKAYTVGAMMSVESNAAGTDIILDVRPNNGINMTRDYFMDLIDDIKVRESHLTTTLHDISTVDNTILGQNFTNENLAASGSTPYGYFMSTVIKTGFNTRVQGNLTGVAVTGNIRDALINDCGYSGTDIDGGIVKVGYIISKDSVAGVENIDFDAGIIITDRDVSISKNFSGIIVTNGTVRIHTGNDISLKACKNLVEAMFKEIPELKVIINSNIGAEPGDDIAINGNRLDHKQLVEKNNWRKNTN
ncbi:MAG: hypothetical protein K2N34_16415 [Lachnospiraceae bacterium]|nr:hypothetical protein [Lachnospiraceae bacterium]